MILFNSQVNSSEASLSSLIIALHTLQQNVTASKKIQNRLLEVKIRLEKELQCSLSCLDDFQKVQSDWMKQCSLSEELIQSQLAAKFEETEAKMQELDQAYLCLLNTLNMTLQSSDLNESSATIEYHTLFELHRELQRWETQLHPINRALASYHSLPPDIVAAKQYIEAAKQELYQLEERLQHCISQLQLQ
jgi:hypothetical protein